MPGGGTGMLQLPLMHVAVVLHCRAGLDPYSHARPSCEHGSPLLGKLGGQGPPPPPLLLLLAPPELDPEPDPEVEPDPELELLPLPVELVPDPELLLPPELDPEPDPLVVPLLLPDVELLPPDVDPLPEVLPLPEPRPDVAPELLPLPEALPPSPPPITPLVAPPHPRKLAHTNTIVAPAGPASCRMDRSTATAVPARVHPSSRLFRVRRRAGLCHPLTPPSSGRRPRNPADLRRAPVGDARHQLALAHADRAPFAEHALGRG
jgi:hypothetical protein